MKLIPKHSIFLLQIIDAGLKLIQRSPGKPFIANAAVEIFPESSDPAKLTEAVSRALKKFKFNHEPVLVSLSRAQVTLRYIKIPSQQPEEIEKIVSLQAPRYLPYPAEELISGFQVISTDKDGFTHVNLVVAHKEVIVRLLGMLERLGANNCSLFVSSFGIAEFYHFNTGEENQVVTCVDLELPVAEIAIVKGDKLLYSRAVKITSRENWQRLLLDEIKRTLDAYRKEVAGVEPEKIVFLQPSFSSKGLFDLIHAETGLLAATLTLSEKISASKDALGVLSRPEVSFASLIGFALKQPAETLNLLPVDKKRLIKGKRLLQERLKFAGAIAGIILIVSLGIAKGLDNKAKYLGRLRSEVAKIEKDALPLTELERRFTFMESHLHKQPLVLDLVHELYQIVPAQISLINFSYEEDKEVSIRGQAPQLNNVFSFVSSLEQSPIYRDYAIKVRYATQKKTLSGELVDFEIAGIRK